MTESPVTTELPAAHALAETVELPTAIELPEAPELPIPAQTVLDALERAGYEAWIVGGWVRDCLLGIRNHDVDIATNARWQEVKQACEATGIVVHETGTAHGTITCVVSGVAVEVTTYRSDGTYSDARHPDFVAFLDNIEGDLARRDFTINAMAYHPARGILDPFGGRTDLEAKLIRCVGNPQLRLREDALRILRALRFACKLGFTIESQTQEALTELAPLLAKIAHERIGVEVSQILATGRASWAMRHEPEVMCAAIPELSNLVGFDQRSPYHAYDVYEHTAFVLAGIEAYAGGVVAPELAWAALLHDIAKPACFTLDPEARGHFFGHPQTGAEIAWDILRRLAIPDEICRAVRALIQHHDRTLYPSASSVLNELYHLDKLCPNRAYVLFHELLLLQQADAFAKASPYIGYASELDEVKAVLRKQKQAGAAYRLRDIALDGNTVMRELQLAPGPLVGRMLKRACRLVIEGRTANDTAALLEALRSELAGEYRIPFEISGNAPNVETIEAIREVKTMKANPNLGKTYSDVDHMMEEF